MTECIALLRGINVGRAKRIAMAELRNIFVDLGHQNVRTLMNSGNVLFRCARPNTAKLALAIQSAIAKRAGFNAPATVITAKTLAAIVRDNPLLKVAADPARHLIAFVAHQHSLAALRHLTQETWAPDVLAFGPQAAYLWCVDGVLDSRLSQEFTRRAGDRITTRNWATVLKLLAASSAAA